MSGVLNSHIITHTSYNNQWQTFYCSISRALSFSITEQYLVFENRLKGFDILKIGWIFLSVGIFHYAFKKYLPQNLLRELCCFLKFAYVLLFVKGLMKLPEWMAQQSVLRYIFLINGQSWTYFVSENKYCVKSVQIRSFPGPYFPVSGLNTEIYCVNLRI